MLVTAVTLATATVGCAGQGAGLARPAEAAAATARSQPVAVTVAPATPAEAPRLTGAEARSRRDVLLKTLSQAEADAACSNDYGVAEIREYLAAGGSDNTAKADALLTEGLLRYAYERGGRAARDGASRVVENFDANDYHRFLAELVPADPAMLRLERAFDFYQTIAASGGWESLPPGAALKRGVTHARVAKLRRRLAATGDLPTADLESTRFDDALEAAVRRFQARHGLQVDGIVGPETRAALNVPAKHRAALISMNLCRYPHLAAKQQGTAIIVNLPGARLRYFREGEPIFATRVIVGRPDWPTPIISDAITAIEINPYWNIPPRIARREVVPRIAEDPGYLAERSIRVLSDATSPPRELDPSGIDWRSVKAGVLPFRLRQDPGPQNPMGSVKFRTTNPYHIFLHDTPAKQLFERSKRGLSHGCVRVQDALRLATLLIGANAEAPAAVLDEALAGGVPVTIPLSAPVPLYFVNRSAWVDEDGTVQFREDPVFDPEQRYCPATLDGVSAVN